MKKVFWYSFEIGNANLADILTKCFSLHQGKSAVSLYRCLNSLQVHLLQIRIEVFASLQRSPSTTACGWTLVSSSDQINRSISGWEAVSQRWMIIEWITWELIWMPTVRLIVNTHGHNPYFCYQLKGQEVQWSSLLEILWTIYTFSLVPLFCPHLEYVNWDPHQKKDIERLVGVQKLGLNVGIKT